METKLAMTCRYIMVLATAERPATSLTPEGREASLTSSSALTTEHGRGQRVQGSNCQFIVPF